MSLGDQSGLGPDPATYGPLGQPGEVPERVDSNPEYEKEPDDESLDTESLDTDAGSDVDPQEGHVR